MSAQQHTPGPWTVPMPIMEGAGHPFTPIAATTLIAKVYSTSFGDHQQSIANATLMAAAPELLDMLRTARAALCMVDGNNLLINEINALITKATGGEK